MVSMRSSLLAAANPMPPPDIPPPPPRPPPPPPRPPCANVTATASNPTNRIRRVMLVSPAPAPAAAHTCIGAAAHAARWASHASAATGRGRKEHAGHQLERLSRILLLVGLQLCVDLGEG